MKKYLITIPILLVLGAFLAVYILGKGPFEVLGADIKLFSYTVAGSPTGQVVLSAPFVANERDRQFLNALVDLNQDGTLDVKSEWVVRNRNTRIAEDYRNNFSFFFGEQKPKAGEMITVRVLLSEDTLPDSWDGYMRSFTKSIAREKKVAVEAHELADVLGFVFPGASPTLKRGGFSAVALAAKPAYAQNAETNQQDVFREPPVPDLPQGSMECTPVSTANNLISLAQEHGEEDRLPQNPRDLIEELKQDMQFANGVLLGNIASGKDAFVERHNLPIVTERIDAPTFEDIRRALASGAAVELSMSMVQSASGHPSTGHVVSVVGGGASSGLPQIAVHDPATPEGMDTLDLSFKARAGGREFEGVDYPLWDGTTFIDAMFVQRWTGVEQARPGTSADGDTSIVQMLVIDGHFFPRHQFRVADPDACGSPHYHATAVYGLKDRTASEIVSMTDPNSSGCGFGKVSDVPVEDLEITQEQSSELIKFTVP
jgi:hypothetical protein